VPFCHTTRLAGLFAALAFLLAGPAAHAAPCPATPEEAARSFLQLGVEAPAASVELLAARPLTRYRARLEQVLNDRYSPMSAAFREKLLGREMTTERLSALSDTALVGLFLGAGEKLRGAATVSDITVLKQRTDRLFGEEIWLRYRVVSTRGETLLERKFSAKQSDGCWRLDVPLEASARLEQLAGILKESRPPLAANRVGPALLPLRVAAASATAREDMREMRQRGQGRNAVWVSEESLASESDILGATASWDCASTEGAEDPSVWIRFNDRAGEALQAWSGKNPGAMLAIAVDGEVVTFARVAGVLGNRLSMCLPGERLETAEALADALRGVRK